MLAHQHKGRQLRGFGNQILSMPAAAWPAALRTFTTNLFHACNRSASPAKASPMSVLALDRQAPKREGGDSAAKAWLRALAATAPIAAHPRRTLPALIEELAETFGDAPALLYDRETLTYRELASRANRYARWALELGVAQGDTVCLMMPNRPEYLAIWLGVTRVGGIVSLIKSGLTGAALPH